MATAVLANINNDFHPILNAQQPLQESHIQEMYDRFLEEFPDAPS